jgi:hypothetical protein
MIGLSVFGITWKVPDKIVDGLAVIGGLSIFTLFLFSLVISIPKLNKKYDVTKKIKKHVGPLLVVALILTVIIIIICPVGLWYSGLFEKNKLFANADTLGYYGALIGGGVTVLGVYWTLKYEIKKSKEERRQERENLNEERRKDSLPILQFKFTPKYYTLEQIKQKHNIKKEYERHDIVIDTTQGSEKHDENFTHEYGWFRIINVGLGAAIISDIKLIRTNPKEVVVKNSSEKELNRRIITPNKEKRLSMTIRSDDFNKEDTLYLTFMDLYSNEYFYKIPFNRMKRNRQYRKTEIFTIDTEIMPNLVPTEK